MQVREVQDHGSTLRHDTQKAILLICDLSGSSGISGFSGLFGLSRVFGLNQTNRINQRNLRWRGFS